MSFKLADVPSIYSNDPKLRKENVAELAEWVKTQQHLPELEELQLILFLHSCYYDLDHAKTTIENYFTTRTHCQLFQVLDKEVIKRTLNSFFIAFLPKKTEDGDVIVMLKMLDTRPEVFNNLEHTQVSLAMITLYLHQYGPPNGIIFISDMKGTSMGHFFKLSISVFKQFTNFIQEAIPARVKQIHYINAVSFTGRIVALAKPFTKKELFDKVKFHSGSIESFYEFVPKECLPQDYGGLLPTIQELNEKNIENVIDNWDFFQWHDGLKVDETKRIKKERGFFGRLFHSS